MNNSDIFKSVVKEKELLEKIAPKFNELADLEEILQQAENPKVLAVLMYKLVQERERTNKLLSGIDSKYDSIMLSLKTTPQTPNTIGNTQQENSTQSRFEVLPEADQTILKMVEDRGGCTAKDIKTMMNYKGLNAACQRLNKLYREGYLKKIQSRRKVLYLAKS